jgi:hypothetical protein
LYTIALFSRPLRSDFARSARANFAASIQWSSSTAFWAIQGEMALRWLALGAAVGAGCALLVRMDTSMLFYSFWRSPA